MNQSTATATVSTPTAPVFLSKKELKEVCPAAFTKTKMKGLSNQYVHYSSEKIVDALGKQGWQPVKAFQMVLREKSKTLNQRQGFQKHCITFQNPKIQFSGKLDEDLIPQVVMVSSHDGTTSMKFHSGVFRMICSNGLIVADQTFQKLRAIHKFYSEEALIADLKEYVKNLPRLIEQINQMKKTKLTPVQKLDFAKQAAKIRYVNSAYVREPQLMLTQQRTEDEANDLWTVFNTAQENIMKGGIASEIKKKGDDGKIKVRKTKSKPMTSIDAIEPINIALWELAAKTAGIKSAATPALN